MKSIAKISSLVAIFLVAIVPLGCLGDDDDDASTTDNTWAAFDFSSTVNSETSGAPGYAPTSPETGQIHKFTYNQTINNNGEVTTLIIDSEYLGKDTVKFKGENKTDLLNWETVSAEKEAFIVAHNITVPRDDANNSFPDWIYVKVYIPINLTPDFTNLWTIAKRVDYTDSNGTEWTYHRPFGVIPGFKFANILTQRRYVNITNGSISISEIENGWIYKRALRNLYGTTMRFGQWFLRGAASVTLKGEAHYEKNFANIYQVNIDIEKGTKSYGDLTLNTFSVGVTTQWKSDNASTINYSIATDCPIPLYLGFSGFDSKEGGSISYSFELTDLQLK